MKRLKRLLPCYTLFIYALAFCFVGYCQEAEDLRAFKMQKQVKSKTTGEISIAQDWTSCSFIISLNLKEKEIEFINNDSKVITWFTVLSKDDSLSDESNSLATFNCIDSKKASCKFTISMSNKPSVYFALIMITYITEAGIITYGYQTKKE